MQFWYFLSVLNRRKWIIAGLVAAALFVVALAPDSKMVHSAKCYMAPTAQVMRGGVSASANATDGQPAPDRTVVLSNLILLANSGDVMKRALDFLAQPVYMQKIKAPGLPSYRQISKISGENGSRWGVSELADAITVAPVINTQIGEQGTTSDIIQIKADMPRPEDATYVANAVGVAFMDAYREKSREDSNKYTEFLEAATADATRKLAQAERRVNNYMRQHRVAAVDTEVQTAVSSMAAIEAARNVAMAEASEARATLKSIDAQLARQPLVKNEPLPGDMNPAVEKLKTQLAQAEAELQEASLRYKPGHTAYKNLAARIDFLKAEIQRESSNYSKPTMNPLHDTLTQRRSEAAARAAAAASKLAVLNGQAGRAQAKVAGMSSVQGDLVALTRDKQTASEQYALFTSRLMQARLADKEFEKYGSIVPYDWSTSAVAVLQGPQKKTLLAYALVLSLVMSIAGAIWLDSIDTRIRTRGQAERLFNLPVLGQIPSIKGDDSRLPRLTSMSPLSAGAESYKMLRAEVLFNGREKPFKTLMVATGRPGQGATTTICNLAIALAQSGKKVILLDADMRRPAARKFKVGLSTVLKGSDPVSNYFQETDIENLTVIPAGPTPLNPSELLSSERMREVVKQLEEQFDYVLFDTPSLGVFSDAQVLANWLDCVLFVLSADKSSRESDQLAMGKIRKTNAEIIGTVLNRMEPDAVDSATYYSHYYATNRVGKQIEVLALPGGQSAGSVISVSGIIEPGVEGAD